MPKPHTQLKTKYQLHRNKIHWGLFIMFSFFISTLLLNPLELNLKKDNNNNFLSNVVVQKKEASAALTLPSWVPATSPLANKEHPRLFFTSGDLPALMGKLKTQYKTEFQDFVNFLDAGFNGDVATKSRSVRSNDAMNYAFLYLVDPNLMSSVFTFGHTREQYGLKAIMHGLAIAQDVLNGTISTEAIGSWESVNMPMALVYDWSYSLLTLQQKRKFTDAFIIMYQTRNLQPGVQLSAWTLFQNFRGPTGGLAIWGDNLDDAITKDHYATQSQILLDLVKTDWIDGIFASLNHFQDNSGWRESWSYNQWSFRGINYFAGMLSTAISQDYFNNTTFKHESPLFAILER